MRRSVLTTVCFLVSFSALLNGQTPEGDHSKDKQDLVQSVASTNIPPNSANTNTVIVPIVTYVTQIREVPKKSEIFLPDQPELWRALVPGAGQFELEEKLKGVVIAGLFTVSAVCSIALYVDAYNLKDKSIKMVHDANQTINYLQRALMMSNARNLWDLALSENGGATALLCTAAAIWAFSAFDYLVTFKRYKSFEIGMLEKTFYFRFRMGM